MTKIDAFWLTNKSWYHWENDIRVINDDDPPEAVESYNNYKRQVEEHYKKTENVQE